MEAISTALKCSTAWPAAKVASLWLDWIVVRSRSCCVTTRRVTAMKVITESRISVITRATPDWDLRFIDKPTDRRCGWRSAA